MGAATGSTIHVAPAVVLVPCRDRACESQAEVDALWAKLLIGGGKPTACGWLQDRYGLSWQIIPTALIDLMSDPDPKAAGRVTQALMGTQKIDLAALLRAQRAT